MSPSSLRPLCLVLVLAVLGGSALDAVLNLGDTFSGEICDPSDVDVLHFDALAATACRVRVTATGPISLRPRLQLIDLGTDQVLADVTAATIQADTLNLQLPSTGQYELRVSSADGSVGPYQLQSIGRYSLDKLNFFTRETVPAGGQSEVGFDALAGFQFFATIQPPNNSQAIPANPVLEGPGGPIALTGFLFQPPNQLAIKGLPLGITSLQSFVLRADNIGGTGQLVTHIMLRPTLPAKNVQESDDCP